MTQAITKSVKLNTHFYRNEVSRPVGLQVWTPEPKRTHYTLTTFQDDDDTTSSCFLLQQKRQHDDETAAILLSPLLRFALMADPSSNSNSFNKAILPAR